MAIENKVTMMPNCHFYHGSSPYISENHVRLAICKKMESVKEVCKRLREIKIEDPYIQARPLVDDGNMEEIDDMLDQM